MKDEDEDEEGRGRDTVVQETDFQLDEFILRCNI